MTSKLLTPLQYFDQPFPHGASSQALRADEAAEILNWFETTAPWKLVEESFYEQYEFSFRDLDVPTHVAPLVGNAFLGYLVQMLSEFFNIPLTSKVDVTAHKLVKGQTIRIHNDYIPGHETHRLLIQFNSGWIDDYGGLLMFFGSTNPKDIRKVFRPSHNSCVAFEISKNSLHAVSTIHSDIRFTLVFSFYAS